MQDTLHQALDKILRQVFTNMFQLLQERIKVGSIHVQSDLSDETKRVPIHETLFCLLAVLDGDSGPVNQLDNGQLCRHCEAEHSWQDDRHPPPPL